MPADDAQIDEVVAVYQRAASLNLQIPAREGNVVCLAPGDARDVMIAGDLHGHRENFAMILSIAGLDRNPRRHLILQEVCHGGPLYESGGCRSHEMLERVAELQAEYPQRVHYLLSNHELAELIDFPVMKAGRMLNLNFRCGLQTAFGERMQEVRQSQLEFLRSLPLAVRLPGGIFVSHTLPCRVDEEDFDFSILERPFDDADLEEGGAVFRFVWGRDYREENARAFAQQVQADLLIHGHDPCPQGCKVPNDWQIIVDCCGQPATTLTVPLGETWTQDALVRRIEPLPA